MTPNLVKPADMKSLNAGVTCESEVAAAKAIV